MTLRTVALCCALAAAAPLFAAATDRCDGLVGWRRIVQLYSGHWDAVSFVSFSGGDSSESTHLLSAVECGVPLSLTQWGVKRPVTCTDGWYSPSDGCQSDSRYSTDGVTPAWKRFASAPKSRVHAFPDVPDVTAVEWVSNQHDSATVRPADVVVYDMVGVSDGSAMLEHLEVQLRELMHAVLVYGPVCAETSTLRKTVFSITNDEHKMTTMYCHEADSHGDNGLIIVRRQSRVEFHGALVRFESTLGAPKSVTGDELFTALADKNQPGVIFKVPTECTHRLTSNPLQRLQWESDGKLSSEAHTGVDHKYLDKLTFRGTKIALSPSFRRTFYSGTYCGVTVFTVAASTSGQKLFYTIAAPIVSALGDFGFPTLMRYDNVEYRPRTPLLSLYFHYEIPRATKRERRFLAYQLEYGPNKVRDKHNLAYLNDSVVPMEYTQAQLQQWRDRGIDRIQQLPLCYHPSIEYNLPATPEPSSNALFPGIINGKPRREEIIQDLKGAGVVVNFRSYLRGGDAAPKYGVEDVIDSLSSEMVLNFHAYANNGEAQLEVPRLTPYLSNGVFVISETGVEETQKKLLSNALVFVPDDQPRMTSALVKQWTGKDNAKRRREVSRRAKSVMKEDFACMTDAAFLASMDEVARHAFPAWYVQSFYVRASKL